MKAKALSALMILVLVPLLNACSTRELNTFNLVTALGIDKDESGYMVTYQVLNPKAVASNKSLHESTSFVYSEKGTGFDMIEKRITAQTARTMYTPHIRTVVLGEDVAKDGISELLDYLFRDDEFRTDYYFAIAKGTTANEVLSAVTVIESVSGMKIYESIENSKKQWASVNSLKIVELINDINAIGNNPVLAGVELSPEADRDDIDHLTKSNGRVVTLSALGAFHDDKLIGWLDEAESISFMNIVGKTKLTANTFDFNESTRVSMTINVKKPKIKVSLSDGKPVISVMLLAETMITTQTGDVDFADQQNLDKLIRIVNGKVTGNCMKILDKAQRELKSDIFGFGENIHKAYPKVWNELKDNWDEEFTKLQVNFSADTKIMDLGLALKPVIREEE